MILGKKTSISTTVIYLGGSRYYFKNCTSHDNTVSQGYKTASFTLTSDEIVDFWVTDDDGYQQWKNDKTPPTAKMYKSTYCSDCTSFNTLFALSSSSTKYYFVVSAMNPSALASGKIEFYYDGTGEYNSPEESKDNVGCFTEEALVQFKNGSSLLLKDARVGDEILAASYSGEVGYSPVIHNPHLANDDTGRIVRVSTGDGSSIQLTRNHLIMTCDAQKEQSNVLNRDNIYSCEHCMTSTSNSRRHMDPLLFLVADEVAQLSPLSLKRADSVIPNRTCLLSSTSTSSTQWTQVVSVVVEPHKSGMYTIVTRAPYPIVNGIVSSPFSHSHTLPHSFYHIHRIAYALGLLNNPVASELLTVLTEAMHRVVNLPEVLVLADVVMQFGHSVTAALSM